METKEAIVEGVSVWIGRDDDGDLFVSVNTEEGYPGVNNANGTPQLYVYLNDAVLFEKGQL